MSKRAKGGARGLLYWLSACLLAAAQGGLAADVPPGSYGSLSAALLERAEKEVSRVQALVNDGTLPRARLEQAQAALADARDADVLARTLYGESRIQDMTSDQAKEMLGAAQRRVDRQAKVVQEHRELLDSGILAKSEFAGFEDELETRRRTRDLAENRARLVDELRQMAMTEQRLEQASRLQTGAVLKDVMIRYTGNGFFNLSDLTDISNRFQKQFHHALPVSAMGQTLVHQSMGLDHRNRVDVGLNPEQPEGVWLRQLLESQHIPYLAFRAAVAGAATAPHIHIGPESTRLKLARR